MMQEDGKRQIKAFLTAFRHLADPFCAVHAQSSPLALVGGSQIDLEMLSTLAHGADRVDADLLYLEFEPGAEARGPSNIVAVLSREGVHYLKRECALWLSEDGRPFLIARGLNSGWASFDPDGLDYHPAMFALPLDAGFVRATAKLRAYAAEALGGASAQGAGAAAPKAA